MKNFAQNRIEKPARPLSQNATRAGALNKKFSANRYEKWTNTMK